MSILLVLSAYEMHVVDGKMYHVRIESHTVFRYYLHEDWRSVVFEQVSTYDVNGVKGYGIFEFLYRSEILFLSLSLQCFHAVGLASGRASGP